MFCSYCEHQKVCKHTEEYARKHKELKISEPKPKEEVIYIELRCHEYKKAATTLFRAPNKDEGVRDEDSC